MRQYSPPVSRLLDYAHAEFNPNWPDYVGELGLGEANVPELIAMATDPALYDASNEKGWSATVHARRALGLVKAVEAVVPLLSAMDAYSNEDDFFLEELPRIFEMIGPAVIPTIVPYLASPEKDEFNRICVVEAIEEIGRRHPDFRDECVGILTRQLARHSEAAEPQFSLNGFLISGLVDLEATESAAQIEEAFAAGHVDEMILGDWPQVCFELGLGPKPLATRFNSLTGPSSTFAYGGQPKRPDLKKIQKKRKAEKKARKQLRKR